MDYQWFFGPATVTTVDNISDVVVVVDWVCLMFDGNGGEWKNSGRITVPPVDPADFIPFDQLTKETVEGWVYAQVDKQQVELSMLIEYQEANKVQVLPFSF